jgi:hypothetical protein
LQPSASVACAIAEQLNTIAEISKNNFFMLGI